MGRAHFILCPSLLSAEMEIEDLSVAATSIEDLVVHLYQEFEI